MTESRIPQLTGTSKKAAKKWLNELHKLGLLFCLDNDPFELLSISDWSRAFTDHEATQLTEILDCLFKKQGDELYAFAYETLAKTFFTPAERREQARMYA